ncbi:MAG: glycosyltransferase, partial [Pyrinomonadaceae bacterium]
PVPDLRQLKVCFLAGTLGRGGAERQLVYMLRALKGAGVSTRVMCLTRGEPFEKEITDLGVAVEWVGESGSRPRRLLRVIRSLRREPADVLQSAHFYTNLYAAAAARATGARDIGAIRNNLFSELEGNGFVIGRAHLRAPRHLIANSRLGRERAVACGVAPGRVDFVPNAVDAEWLNAGHARNGYKQNGHGRDGHSKNGHGRNGREPVRILFAGRLTEQKRPDRFLRVVSAVMGASAGRPVKALMAGDGPLRGSVESLAGTLGLGPDRLELLGGQSDMRGVYACADMLVLTSDWEGTPNVVLEAMACGLPVVATRVGGVEEIVTADRGLLTAPDDEDGLRAATLRLVTDTTLRAELGRGGRLYVAGSHSLGALGERLLGIYGRLLECR